MASKQRTLSESISIEGVGLHTGLPVCLKFKPAPENTGFVFVRTDIEGHPQIKANALYVTNTQRGTTLEKEGVSVHNTEHVLAALVGADLDNVFIELNAPEIPILDGSAKPFLDLVTSVLHVEQNSYRWIYKPKDVISIKDDKTGAEIIAIPDDNYSIIAMFDFNTKHLGMQSAQLSHIERFKDEIAQARTFCFLHEIEPLLEAGLIKGGTLSNAIVYVDKDISTKTRKRLNETFNTDMDMEVMVSESGILNNVNLQYPNEAARHKILDIIGDLALIGRSIQAKIIANKTGHFINTEFAKKVISQMKKEEQNNTYEFDLDTPSVYNVQEIMKMLPHRYPFLLVDKIIEKTDNTVVGVKNVTINEPFFVGHFPKEPVMPGVLQVEAMAQVGGIFVLSAVEEPENYNTYFLKIDNVRFKQKVIPGDTVVFKCTLLGPIRRGIVHMQCYGYVKGKVVSQAELTAQVVKERSTV